MMQWYAIAIITSIGLTNARNYTYAGGRMDQEGLYLRYGVGRGSLVSSYSILHDTNNRFISVDKSNQFQQPNEAVQIPVFHENNSQIVIKEGIMVLPKNVSSISPKKEAYTPTDSSTNDVIPTLSICNDYTSYLKTVTPDILKPFLVNVDVYVVGQSLVFYIVISTMHLDNYESEQHNQYTLLFLNTSYPNLFARRNRDIGYSVLKYSVPTSLQYNEGDIIEFSLIDIKRHHPYNNIKACIRLPNPHPSPMGVCAYVSDYNTINELRFWISHYRVQNVSMVIFYVATPMPQLVTEFGGLIRSGYLRLVDFTWPRHVRGWPIQCSNQQAQINSCFYHFKYEVQSLILCDTDEFIYSELYPYNLPSLNSYFSQSHRSFNVIHVSIQFIINHQLLANRYKNKEGDFSNRESHLHNGTLFDAYQWRLGTYTSGAKKMIVHNTFDGFLGTHICQYCKDYDPIPINVARIAHIRKRMGYEGSLEYSSFLSQFTPALKKMVSMAV